MRSLKEIVGQSETVARLATLVDLHRRSKTALGHLLLIGPDGHGKRTIAHAVAASLGVNLREAESDTLERAGDLAAILADLEEGDILLLRNIKRTRRWAADMLSKAMRTFELQVVVGKGASTRTMKLAVKPFTCIGTALREGECPPELTASFDTVLKLDPYRRDEIRGLVEQAFAEERVSVEPATFETIANLSKGSPKHARLLVGRLASLGKPALSESEANEILSAYGHQVGGIGTGDRNGEPPNVSMLSGIQFEELVLGLLQKMGFRAVMTKATGDGGIDIEATLEKPIVGGRYLIQCKRFAPEFQVGSPTVREFYGALTADRKAVKGILITTSGFTAHALDFARALPIELIDGTQLEQLLSQYAGSPEL